MSEKSLSSLKDNFCRHDPNPFSQTQFFHCRTLTRAVFSPLFCSQLCSRHQDSRFQITFFIKRLHQGLCPTESSINSWPDSFCSALATMTLSMTKRMDCFTEAHHCLADVTDWISASHASQVLNFSCLWDPVRFCWQACCLQFYIFSTHAQSFWLLCQTWSCDVCIETKLNLKKHWLVNQMPSCIFRKHGRNTARRLQTSQSPCLRTKAYHTKRCQTTGPKT